jgi:hypothetical protein
MHRLSSAFRLFADVLSQGPRLRTLALRTVALRTVALRTVALTGAVLASPLVGMLPGRANPPETAPVALTAALVQLDAAANSRNLSSVLNFYGPNFSHSDGLNRTTLEKALTQLWKQFPTLSYRTALKSWTAEGTDWVAETETTITGTQVVGDREFRLDATLQSQQRFANQKIVRQDILRERSQLTSGANPPTVKLNLPDQVLVGQDFSLDAIVQEPLGDDLLLGAALEEPISPDGLLNPTRVNLEALASGGIFKVGRAPLTPDSRWISAVVVRQSGITMVTQRLRVTPRK